MISDFFKEFPGAVEAIATVLSVIGAVYFYYRSNKNALIAERRECFWAIANCRRYPQGGPAPISVLMNAINRVLVLFPEKRVRPHLSIFSQYTAPGVNINVQDLDNALVDLLTTMAKEASIKMSTSEIRSLKAYYPNGFTNPDEVQSALLSSLILQTLSITEGQAKQLRSYLSDKKRKDAFFNNLSRALETEGDANVTT